MLPEPWGADRSLRSRLRPGPNAMAKALLVSKDGAIAIEAIERPTPILQRPVKSPLNEFRRYQIVLGPRDARDEDQVLEYQEC